MTKIFSLLVIVVALSSCKIKTPTTTSNPNPDKGIEWLNTASLSDAKQKSMEVNKLIFVDIETDWCGYCKKMKKNVFPQEMISTAINSNFLALSLDGEKGDGAKLVNTLNLEGFPTQLVLDAKGNVVKRHTGYLSTNQLLSFLK